MCRGSLPEPRLFDSLIFNLSRGVHKRQMPTPLVRADTFIRATRETGYRSPAFAVAELVDNALQASATKVNILIGEEGSDAEGRLTVTVVDDGIGMSAEQLNQALQFGGSSRFDNRNGQGRFGMGLPSASVSLARRVDLYSWSNKARALHTYLDSDAISSGRRLGLPPVLQRKLPQHLLLLGGPSGTAVLWTKCDRIPYRRSRALIAHLRRELGRIFRKQLGAQFSILINGDLVIGVDPLRAQHVPNIDGSVTILPPLVFPFAVPGLGTSSVHVTFAVLPVAKWAELSNEQKRALGITGSGTVSVLRAGREVALGWYLMGGKRRENYDDWWRCEIAFEPVLDEWFGVTHSKQGIRPSPELTAAVSPSLETQARSLNRIVRKEFAKFKERESGAAAVAKLCHHKLVLGSEKRSQWRKDRREPRFVSPVYTIDVKPLPDAEFLLARRRLDKVILCLNSNHAFYRRLYGLLEREGSKKMRQSMDLFLLSLARVLSSVRTRDRDSWNRLIETWSNAAEVLLEER